MDGVAVDWWSVVSDGGPTALMALAIYALVIRGWVVVRRETEYRDALIEKLRTDYEARIAKSEAQEARYEGMLFELLGATKQLAEVGARLGGVGVDDAGRRDQATPRAP